MLAAEPIEMDTSNLTQPLLTDGDEEFIGDISAKASRSPSPIRQSVISDSKSDAPNVDETQADSESRPQQLRSGFLNPDPSDSQLQYTRESKLDERPQLEYEPSDIDDDDPPPVSTVKILKPQHKDVLLTASEPVCIICENCGTTCQTTVIHVFGLSTCLWICLLLVLCFPIAWLPLFWKDCHDTKHYCTYCSAELGRAKAKCCQFKKMGGEIDRMEEDLEQRVAEVKKNLL